MVTLWVLNAVRLYDINVVLVQVLNGIEQHIYGIKLSFVEWRFTQHLSGILYAFEWYMPVR